MLNQIALYTKSSIKVINRNTHKKGDKDNKARTELTYDVKHNEQTKNEEEKKTEEMKGILQTTRHEV